MTAMGEFQNQEINVVLEQIYKMIDENTKKGLFNLYIGLVRDDFVFRFSEQIQTLLKENDNFCRLIERRLLQDGYRVELLNFGSQMKRLDVHWNKQDIEQPKEKKKKWFWQKG